MTSSTDVSTKNIQRTFKYAIKKYTWRARRDRCQPLGHTETRRALWILEKRIR